ncbi:MAG: FAD:protein FMN transferase [Actinomycetota bacterium]
MGTVVSLDIRDTTVSTYGVEAFFKLLRDVDERFSTYKDGSEVSCIARGEIALNDASDELREVLDLCAQVRRVSNGSFDVWKHRPDGMFDPSGLVKGWSLERGARILTDHGAESFCINGGGDVIAHGEPEPGVPWKVGIRHPEQADRVAAVIGVRDLAVATSGAYERGEHIFDPKTHDAARGLLSMTVVGPSMTLADSYATAAFAMGVEGIEWIARMEDYCGFAITRAHRSVWTNDFDSLMIREETIES